MPWYKDSHFVGYIENVVNTHVRVIVNNSVKKHFIMTGLQYNDNAL